MKKLLSVLAVTVLLVTMFAMTATAAAATATLTGPGTVRAGDKITLTFNLNGNGSSIYGASGTLSYDSSQVTLSGTSQKIASPWAVEFNGNNFVAYDNNLSSPVKTNKALFTVTFTVKSNVATGANLKISYTNVKASDGNADTNIGTVTYSKTVAAPLSTNNDLASLNVSNATISPAFNAGTTNYTAEVPFSVSKLNVTATAADGKAKVAINSPNLTPAGTTKVTVTVTAENGSKKTYTISVKREKDPNYVASGNNNLSGITVNGFVLSPVFSADNTNYVVWLPYETTGVAVSGTPADSKASVQVVGGDTLAAGQDNPVKVICTAENGDKKEYTVIVKRAAAHDGSVDDKPTTTTTTTTTQADTPATTTNAPADPAPAQSEGGIPVWMLAAVGVAALILGVIIGMVIAKKKG